jgi:flavodoxin
MKSLVVYSSQTGNTRKLAEAVAQYRKQAHAIPARSMDEPDFAGAALIDALCYWRRNAGTGCESFCDDGFHYGVGDNRFGAVTGGDGSTGQKICPYQKCPVYGFVHSHKYSDSVNLLRITSLPKSGIWAGFTTGYA